MYKVIFIALLLVLPAVVANTSPNEGFYEIGKRLSGKNKLFVFVLLFVFISIWFLFYHHFTRCEFFKQVLTFSLLLDSKRQ